MAYSKKAEERRRCLGKNRDGSPCKAWALWEGDEQFCRHHAPRLTRLTFKAAQLVTPICNCEAYAWPHRPGGGFCQWPDAPTERSTVIAGKHKSRAKPKKAKRRKRREEITFYEEIIFEGGQERRFTWDSKADPIEKLEAWREARKGRKN